MKVAILKYNAGNVQSVLFALQRLQVDATLTDSPVDLERADKVIFPGVGEARSAMNSLLDSGTAQLLPRLKQPFLGICLGMQLMCRHSAEGDTACLGIFPGEVKRLPAGGKVPHIGWNNLTEMKGPLFKGITGGSFVYYVHSYCAQLSESTAAITDYLTPFSAALQKDNFYGVQFHPEKSADVGAQILKNFLDL